MKLMIKCMSAQEASFVVDKLNRFIHSLFPKIHDAVYGVCDSWLDVTATLNDLIRSRKTNRLRNDDVDYDRDLFGYDEKDPYKPIPKVLLVTFGKGTRTVNKVFFENEPVIL